MERFHEVEPDNAWIVARHYGMPVPGEPSKPGSRWPFLRIAKQLGIKEDAARRRKDRAIPRLRKIFEKALQETVDRPEDLASAWERLFGAMAEEQPELGRDLDVDR